MTASPPRGWRPDVLGGGFESLELPLPDDDEGPVVATLVRHAAPEAPAPGNVVLYLHGWADYFLQAELARRLVAGGFHFYALDLRKFGRSLRT